MYLKCQISVKSKHNFLFWKSCDVHLGWFWTRRRNLTTGLSNKHVQLWDAMRAAANFVRPYCSFPHAFAELSQAQIHTVSFVLSGSPRKFNTRKTFNGQRKDTFEAGVQRTQFVCFYNHVYRNWTCDLRSTGNLSLRGRVHWLSNIRMASWWLLIPSVRLLLFLLILFATRLLFDLR